MRWTKLLVETEKGRVIGYDGLPWEIWRLMNLLIWQSYMCSFDTTSLLTKRLIFSE